MKTDVTGDIELLSPAGSPEALDAAIAGGADAVYFGLNLYSNRMRAKNFSEDEIVRAIEKCRLHGVKSYVTMNIRMHTQETEDALKKAETVYNAGADAFIVADIGLASLLKEHFPEMSLHASTQMTGINASDSAALGRYGFSRMVCPRELSGSEIKSLCGKSDIDIEMFIHGAHCVSLSGQCLMSYAMGGRSGNRGECAQPCRLPYTLRSKAGVISKGYPISLKDMCLAGHITEILRSGVRSLKIEGRQKNADYVYGVTKIYRRLIDEKRNAAAEETEELERLFSRGGFTDGYFVSSYANMLGIRGENEEHLSSSSSGFPPVRKNRIRAEITVRKNEKIVLVLEKDGQYKVSVQGYEALPSTGAPLSEERIRDCLIKTKDTPFDLEREDIDVVTDGESFVPISRLNEIRREALSRLEEMIISSGRRNAVLIAGKRRLLQVERRKFLTAEFPAPDSIPSDAEKFFDVIFLPQITDNPYFGLNLPAFEADENRIKEKLISFKNAGGRYVLVNTLGQLSDAKALGLVPVASFRFNVTNTYSVCELSSLGAEYIILSPELKGNVISAVCRERGDAGMVCYGHLPVMTLRRCAVGDGRCSKDRCLGECRKNDYSLSDRKNKTMDIITEENGINVITNSVPLWCAENFDDYSHASVRHFIFMKETKEEVTDVTERYRKHCPPKDSSIRRI